VTRSHFDAQDFMESGTPGDRQTPTGWLDRAIAKVPGSEVTQAVSFSSQLPRSFLGPEPVLVAQTLASFDLRARNWRAEAETLLRVMYEADATAVGSTGRETFEAVNTQLHAPAPPPANGAVYPTATVGSSLRQAAQLIKAGIGTRCIFVNLNGGFDTHSNQLQNNTNDYRPLGRAQRLRADSAACRQRGAPGDDRVRQDRCRQRCRTTTAPACMVVLGGRVRGGQVPAAAGLSARSIRARPGDRRLA
jgi:uncharacterized protein (DUF1501 family)